MHRLRRGFTLIEILVVIGMLAVLATITALVLNPAELLAQARDTKRINDLNTLNASLNLYQSQAGLLVASNTVYISLPDNGTDDDGNLINDDCDELALPVLPSGWRYKCVLSANLRSTTGSGWIPIAFSATAGLSLAALPIDPVNSAANQNYYTFIEGSWNLTAHLESSKLTKSTGLTDGGIDPARYEQGSDKKLWAAASGLVGYWPMDEGSGTTTSDTSGYATAIGGTLNGGAAWANCKIGACVSFDGVDDYVDIPHNTKLNITGPITISAWIKPQTPFLDFMAKTSWDVMRMILNEGGPNNVKAVYTIGGVSGVLTLSANNVISADTWTYVVYTYDGSKTQVYINGLASNSSVNASGALNTNTSDLQIGCWCTGGNPSPRFYKGSIDDVRIYSRALLASEIAAIYNATK